MKKGNKIVCAALCSAFALGAVGCGGVGGNVPDTATDVQIYYWKAGEGVEYMQKIVDDYNKKQSEYTVTLDYDSNASTIIKTLDLGEDNTYDLYFTMLNTMQYNSEFLKLDDVLDSRADGESVTIRDKIYPSLLNGVKNSDGTSYFLPYGNAWCGIVYNTDIIDGIKYDVPRTTDELEYLVVDLTNDASLSKAGVKPWLFFNSSGGNGYWIYPMTGWQVQYDGRDYYNDTFMQLRAIDGSTPSKQVISERDGRYKALKVAEKIVTPATVHPECTNTNFTKVQTLFLQGQAVFNVNGGWLLNESSGTANVAIMKLPVISSIVEKLENSDMSDETLSEIVKQVDEGADSSSLCSAKDFERIKQARNVLYNNGAEHYAFVPAYSKAADGAKDFLKYYYSDEGIVTRMSYTQMPHAAKLTDESKFDKSSLSEWNKQLFSLTDTATAITGLVDKSEVFTNLGSDGYLGISYIMPFCAANPKDRKDSEKVWTSLINKINENWEDWSK